MMPGISLSLSLSLSLSVLMTIFQGGPWLVDTKMYMAEWQ